MALHLIRRGAALTARYLFGGLVVGVGLGLLLSPFPAQRPAQYVLATVTALAVISAAGAGWGHAMGRLAGSPEPRRMAWAGALAFAPTVVIAGITLGLLEGALVGRASGQGIPVHVVFTLLFVPTAFLVAAVGGLSVGIGLRRVDLAGKLALGAVTCAAVAFLAVNLIMDAIGWRVGAPGAAQLATMLPVTALGCLTATLAAGGFIGLILGRHTRPESDVASKHGST